MFTRIVKMEFKQENVQDFLDNFETVKKSIRHFPGCEFLELYRDKDNTNIFFTYSKWNTENELENYRNSNLFKEVWAYTKTLFSEKPQAWSVDTIE